MKKNEKKIKQPKSLNFILWISFFFFALLTVVVFGFSEITVLHNVFRERTVQNLNSAAKSIEGELRGHFFWDIQISACLIGASEEYDVTARIVSKEGVVLFPRIENDSSIEAEFAEEVAEMQENVGCVYLVESNVYAYVGILQINGEETFLYVTDTYTFGGSSIGIMALQTAYIALVLLLIASVTSGAISMYISQPIADLTAKARKMSAGNFDLNFSPNGRVTYQEIEELSDSLNYAESELSKADGIQKELIANVSHDFKTPLTMIKAYASMIQEISGDDPEKRAKHSQVIIDEADRLSSLVNDMLELSKIRAGLDSLKLTLFNLSDYLHTVVERFDYFKETLGYRFNLDVADDLYVEADKDKICQVLYNLIGNAVNYTGEDKTVTVRLYGENGLAHFTVTDTGKGIPPEELNEIWERYYRSGETHKRPVKGTGLGLSIVKTILVKHEFNFGVRSELGKGSTFYVDFPVKTVVEIEE